MPRVLAIIGACALAPGLCLAQDGGLLRGPEVPDEKTETLVSRTMTGDFERLQMRPEAAALLEIGLDEETARRAEAVIDARLDAVTMMLVDRIDDLKAMTDASNRGERERAQELLEALWVDFEPARPRAPLLDSLRAVLSPEQLADATRLVDGYWEAWIDHELRRRPERRGDPEVRRRVEERLAFQLFQRDVRRGYDASLRRYHEVLQAVYSAVLPTPDQRETLRMIVIDHIKATRFSATPEQRRETMMRMYRSLDEQRREKFFGYAAAALIPDG